MQDRKLAFLTAAVDRKTVSPDRLAKAADAASNHLSAQNLADWNKSALKGISLSRHPTSGSSCSGLVPASALLHFGWMAG